MELFIVSWKKNAEFSKNHTGLLGPDEADAFIEEKGEGYKKNPSQNFLG